MAVRMELSRILIRELNDYQIIELREAGIPEPAPGGGDGDRARSFPIVIGLPEAQAIERRLKGITIKRPQTHDLLASVIAQLGGALESITITDLADHTFYATLNVRLGGKGPAGAGAAPGGKGELIHIDSRPSDAIALGIAQDVPIFVEEHVLEAAINEEP